MFSRRRRLVTKISQATLVPIWVVQVTNCQLREDKPEGETHAKKGGRTAALFEFRLDDLVLG